MNELAFLTFHNYALEKRGQVFNSFSMCFMVGKANGWGHYHNKVLAWGGKHRQVPNFDNGQDPICYLKKKWWAFM